MKTKWFSIMLLLLVLIFTLFCKKVWSKFTIKKWARSSAGRASPLQQTFRKSLIKMQEHYKIGGGRGFENIMGSQRVRPLYRIVPPSPLNLFSKKDSSKNKIQKAKSK